MKKATKFPIAMIVIVLMSTTTLMLFLAFHDEKILNSKEVEESIRTSPDPKLFSKCLLDHIDKQRGGVDVKDAHICRSLVDNYVLDKTNDMKVAEIKALLEKEINPQPNK